MFLLYTKAPTNYRLFPLNPLLNLREIYKTRPTTALKTLLPLVLDASNAPSITMSSQILERQKNNHSSFLSTLLFNLSAILRKEFMLFQWLPPLLQRYHDVR